MVADTETVRAVPDGRDDFDFIFGRWRIHNRKLRDTADPDCTEWVEFEATSHAEPILGGLGHIDRMWAEAPPAARAFEGFTLRQFDPDQRIWRIWWASTNRPGYLDPPVVGAWRDGRGRFECDDVLRGRAVKVRFEWRHDSPETARWEQTFSFDGGATWRSNWVMELTRLD